MKYKIINKKSCYIQKTVKLGNNCIIYPNCVLQNCIVPSGSIIKAGSVIIS